MYKKLIVVCALLMLLVSTTNFTPISAQEECEELTEVTLVLQWVVQAQFAGYLAAADLGYYEEVCLDVTIRPGGPDINGDQVVASGEAEFGIRPFVNTLAAREAGTDLVSIARVNQVVPTLVVSFADSGIEEPEDLEGRVVGSWLGGNETVLFALMRSVGIEPDEDVEIVKQGFDMSQLLNGEIEAAQATIYNEYAQVLETINPETGELYTAEDFNTIFTADYGMTMLQDNIFTRESFLAEEGNEDLAVDFMYASFRGWIYCRDNPDECVDIVLANGSALGESHQTWMINQFNNLLWPAPNGIGILNNPDAIDLTVELALEYELIESEPDEGAYRLDLVEVAVNKLIEDGYDVYGEDFVPNEVELLPGGE